MERFFASKIVHVCLVLFVIIIPNIGILKAGTSISVSVGNIYWNISTQKDVSRSLKILITFDTVIFGLRIYLRENQYMQRFMRNRAFIKSDELPWPSSG